MKKIFALLTVVLITTNIFAESWVEFELRCWNRGEKPTFEKYSEGKVETLDDLMMMASLVAADNNLADFPDWEIAVVEYWNNCIEVEETPSFKGFETFLNYSGHCDLEKMDEEAQKQGFANFFEYDEWKFQQDINS